MDGPLLDCLKDSPRAGPKSTKALETLVKICGAAGVPWEPPPKLSEERILEMHRTCVRLLLEPDTEDRRKECVMLSKRLASWPADIHS